MDGVDAMDKVDMMDKLHERTQGLRLYERKLKYQGR